jgi:hypothetical protein
MRIIGKIRLLYLIRNITGKRVPLSAPVSGDQIRAQVVAGVTVKVEQ